MERTLGIIKPDCVKTHVIGKVIEMIEENGFKVLSMKEVSLSRRDAVRFYAVHEGKPFFESLIQFMTSGPIIVIALEKDNAVADYRNMIGATNPEEARDGSVRALFGSDVLNNCVHGSDSPENGEREVRFFFSDRELFRG